MGVIIGSAKINLKKIDKSRVFKGKKMPGGGEVGLALIEMKSLEDDQKDYQDGRECLEIFGEGRYALVHRKDPGHRRIEADPEGQHHTGKDNNSVRDY